MKMSLFINPEHHPDDSMSARLQDHVEQVRLAREIGFDGVAIGSHLNYGSEVWFPALETLMRLAPEAKGMTLSTCMLVLPLYHPLHVAAQLALVDAACGGQAILGVSPGWQEDEFRIMGLEHKARISRFVESVELIKRLFIEDSVTFDGRHFSVEDLTLALKPVRKPRPPFWFGGSVEKAVARAARLADTSLGDTWVASSHLTRDVIVEQASVFRNTLAGLGKDTPDDFPLLRNVVVAPNRETAIRDAGPFLAASYRVFGEWGLFTDVVGSGKPQLEFDELLAGRVVIGSPEQCAEQFADLAQATGCTRFITRIQWLGMDQKLVLRTLELLGERVLPMLQLST